MSALRSRSGGSLICTTFRRKYRSWRKPPVRMAGFEIAVGGRDHARADADALVGADRLDFALLQRAQQLGLQIDGQVANFVEEQRALAGGFEQTLLGVLRAGKRALDVAEQLRFDQRGHQRGAIHRRKGLVLARPGKMDRARHQFLARPALAENQHRIGVLRHFLDQLVHPLHPRGHPDQPAKSRPAAQLLAQQAVFLVHLDGVHQAVQLGTQFLHVKRFRDVVGGPQAAWLRWPWRSSRTASAR